MFFNFQTWIHPSPRWGSLFRLEAFKENRAEPLKGRKKKQTYLKNWFCFLNAYKSTIKCIFLERKLSLPGYFSGLYTANDYSQITFTLLWKLARNTKGICKCQVRQYMSKKYADLEQKLLKSKSSLLVLQVILRNHGT